KLLLAGDTPGVALRSALATGSAAGGTVLIVETKYRPVTGFFGGDNTLAGSLGGFSIGAGLDANTLLGLGETIYIRAFGHPGGNDSTGYGSLVGGEPRLRTLSVGGVVPLGTDGLTFNVEATESRTTPRLQNGIQTASVYDRLSFRLRYPWLRTRLYNLSSEAMFDVTSEDLRLLAPGLSLPLSLDRLRIFRLATDGDMRFDGGGVLSGRALLSLGIDGLGARNAASATPLLPLSRFGADAEFQKLEGSVTFVQPIVEHLVASIYVRGQTSFGQVLPRSEQIGFASFLELSTFDAGTLGGDSGWVVRGELSSPWTVPVGSTPVSVAPYVFGATGQLYLEQPTIFERSRLNVSAVGVGLRLAAAVEELAQASLTLEFGRRFRDDFFPDGNRFTVVGSIRF
ncbi:MAG: ShlB/FhaC/HecB family hemolysin secretion/activation protein, partial [Enterovirga sp.]|nr:ShlB/FhaC/HecB family hemolysin secretion/activation protein [Enterovirga sp.]